MILELWERGDAPATTASAPNSSQGSSTSGSSSSGSTTGNSSGSGDDRSDPAQRHYVRVLYNQEQVDMTPLCGGATCTLRTFLDQVLCKYALSQEAHEAQCAARFVHDEPLPDHMDVTTGASVQEDEED